MADDQSPRKRPPSGADLGWTAIGYLIAGIGVWGGVGWLVDRWLGIPMGLGVMVGMLVGGAGAIYMIVKRLGT
ncbi:hypothetical protein [Hamadaea tsunoensis]|uniref:hypothetical protein n=1 Tax=Hamadaea tsunoensis TaxID=53368 RepID=UPI000486AA58|nr:hypothetical protein [Hamadaea tsunoensis]